MASDGRGILAKMFRPPVLIGATLVCLAFLGGLGVSLVLWGAQPSSLRLPALAQCGQFSGGFCPGQYTTLRGLVNVTLGTPYLIVLAGVFPMGAVPTQSAGIFYENGHYGYFGLYVPVYETIHGFTLFSANGTQVPPDSHLNIVYHVSIRYLTGSTNQTCTPRPSVFTPALAEWTEQDFSC